MDLTSSGQNLQNKIATLQHYGDDTCIGCGLLLAWQDLQDYGRPNIPNVIILLTDGINDVDGSTFQSTLHT